MDIHSALASGRNSASHQEGESCDQERNPATPEMDLAVTPLGLVLMSNCYQSSHFHG
jgi:hypothetical protein